jgi:hypothetical protein
MLIRKTIMLAASAVLASTMTVAAFAHDGDACVTEETIECLDDDDFWACFDFIVEDCKNHDLPHARADLNKFKAKARQRAMQILQQHQAALKR